MEFDHLAVAAETLAEGVAWVESALGLPLEGGGWHPLFGTHNKLLSLGPGAYLEVIAVDPSKTPEGSRPRWFGLDHFEGPPKLISWIVRTSDFALALADMPYPPHDVLALRRGDYRWRMALPQSGGVPLDGAAPKLIAWDGPHPAASLTDLGARLGKLEVRHPEVSQLTGLKALGDWLDLGPGAVSLRARIDTEDGPRWL